VTVREGQSCDSIGVSTRAKSILSSYQQFSDRRRKHLDRKKTRVTIALVFQHPSSGFFWRATLIPHLLLVESMGEGFDG
jgi:hypothetical protein